MANSQIVTGTILENTRLARDVYSLVIVERTLADDVKPGQFVLVTCGAGTLLRRPISVCDVEDDAIRLVYEVKGVGTKWMSELNKGDEIELQGPLGNGFESANPAMRDPAARNLLVGGGLGVAPLLFLARSLDGDVDAKLGFASRDKAILIPDFVEHCDDVKITTDDGSLGRKGRVTDLALAGYDHVYACGPRAMLEAVAASVSSPCYVALEERMACGMGSCLVCVCATTSGYKRVCSDGPVFIANEVIWS